MNEAQKVMARKHLTEVQLQLAMPTVQSYDRKTVWLMMRHIEAQEDTIARLEKSADHLQDLVIKMLQKKPTLWERVKGVFK